MEKLLSKKKSKLKDWEERFFAAKGRLATLQDVDQNPKVKQLRQEIKTLHAELLRKNAESIMDAKMAQKPLNDQQENQDVIMPTPTKEKSVKGLFKSLSCTNVLQKRLVEAQEENDQQMSKRAKVGPFSQISSTAVIDRDGWMRPSPFGPMKNAFGITLKNPVDSSSIPGVTIDEDEQASKDVNAIKKMISNEIHFGTRRKAKFSKTVSSPNILSPQFQKAKLLADKTALGKDENPQKGQDSPFLKPCKPFQSPDLPTAKNWRHKPIATPLKKAVEKAMNPQPCSNSSFIAPHTFVNHRSLKRAQSFTLPIPVNYQEFLTKEEELKFASIINETCPNDPTLAADDSIKQPDDLEENNLENSIQSPALPPAPDSSSKPPKRKTTKPKRIAASSSEESEEDYSSMEESDSSDGEEEQQKAKPTKAVKKATEKKTRKKTPVKRKPSNSTKPKEKPDTMGESSKQSGWDSKKTSKNASGNQNFRAFNLKSKKGGKGSVPKGFGKSKFHKTKKLSSYNYKTNDQQHLIAGYEEGAVLLDQVVDDRVIVDEASKVNVDPSEFFTKQVVPNNEEMQEENGPSICTISEKFGGIEQQPTVDLLAALKSLTGLSSFRKGQEQVIRRILEYKSTLFILPTGGGKSLCYQLPAYILRHLPKKTHSMVLIISPTISLMMDQLHCLAKGLRGACLSSAEQGASANKVLEKVKACEIDILFISPERLRSDSFLALIQTGKFPPISFVCIDEVHCISEWSHNFRTSYLHLHSALLQTLKVECILGLTGTATLASQSSICDMLCIDREKGVVAHGFMRDNLILSASMLGDMDNSDTALMDLLLSEKYKGFKSIIIYVMFQNQADQLAQYLRIRNFDVESYHAGKPPEVRAQTQSRFLRGALRILTATVAFGMGINKPDIDAVIHFSFPKSVENYVQEIGRAGRDGREARCHVFLSRQDYIKHRSLVYSDAVDEVELMNFLKLILNHKEKYLGLEVSEYERKFDIKRTVLATILSYIELDHSDILETLPATNGTITLYFVGENTLESMCNEIDWFWEISSTCTKSRGGIQFDLVRIANAADMMPRQIMSALWSLQSAKRIRFKSDNPILLVRLNKSTTVTQALIRDLCLKLMVKLNRMEKIKVLKLDETYEMLHSICLPSAGLIDEENDIKERQDTLSKSMTSYFTRSSEEESQASQARAKYGFRDSRLVENQKICQMAVEIAIKQFVRAHHDEVQSGRTVARIFHGISSPKYPAFEWCKNEFWGKFTHFNHVEISRMALKTILDFKAKNGINND